MAAADDPPTRCLFCAVDYKMVAGVFGVPMKLGILPGPPARTTIGYALLCSPLIECVYVLQLPTNQPTNATHMHHMGRFDFAGTVASLGPDTSGNLNIGDRVMVYQVTQQPLPITARSHDSTLDAPHRTLRARMPLQSTPW